LVYLRINKISPYSVFPLSFRTATAPCISSTCTYLPLSGAMAISGYGLGSGPHPPESRPLIITSFDPNIRATTLVYKPCRKLQASKDGVLKYSTCNLII
jgi:hypothetical protein